MKVLQTLFQPEKDPNPILLKKSTLQNRKEKSNYYETTLEPWSEISQQALSVNRFLCGHAY